MRRWIILIVLLLILLVWLAWVVRPVPSLDERERTVSTSPSHSEDEIHLLGATANHSAAILIDGRRAACVDDEVVRATQTVAVGNILSPSACDSRVAVFVQDKAMHFAEGDGPWTDNRGDTLDVTLAEMPKLPIAVWTPRGGKGDAQVHADSAGPIYNDMQSGIGFEDMVPIVEARGLDSMNAGCNDLAPVRAVGFTLGHLNVYYVQEITDAVDARGIHCDTDPNVILISTSIGVIGTFSHEVGHALSLGHTNNVDGLNTYTETEPGLAVCNLMLQSGVNQRLLSTGQCFRTNLNSDSAINRLGARTGPMPGCDPVNGTPICPPLALDVKPK